MHPHLHGLTPQEIDFRIQKTRWDLLNAYIRGDLSAAQCRAIFKDYIRDLLSEQDEAELLRRHSADIEVATFERETAPEDEEIDHSLNMVQMNLRLGASTRTTSSGTF